MIILDICDNVSVLKVMRIIKIVITIIKISVPILLIIFTMLEFLKAVKDTADLENAKKSVHHKLIAAVLIFLIPTFVNIIVKSLDGNSVEFAKCIQNSTTEKINEVEADSARKYVDRAKDTLDYSDYVNARNQANTVSDQTKRNEMLNELNVVNNYFELKNQINELSKNYNSEKANSLYEKINAIEDEKIKNELLSLLDEVGVGKPLNVEAGMHLKTYNDMKYYEIIPEGATTNMPLIIYYIGGNPHGAFQKPDSIIVKNEPTKTILSGTAYKYQKFIYIFPDYTANTASSFKKTKELLDYVVEEYSIDKNKIIITGVSNGAVATFWMAYNYPNYFSAVVPICGPAYDYTPPYSYTILPKDYINKASSLVGVSFFGITAGRYDYGNYETKTKTIIKKIHKIDPKSKALYAAKRDEFISVLKNELGKEPTDVPTISKYEHCTVTAYYHSPEFWEWMLKQ